ncbi:MAG: hypothetical protein AAF355_01340 [Myxococcota bacterium]
MTKDKEELGIGRDFKVGGISEYLLDSTPIEISGFEKFYKTFSGL